MKKYFLLMLILAINLYSNEGLAIGDNSISIGSSVATGRNSIAIGKNSAAVGNDETKDSVVRKIEENRVKLTEIENKEKEIKNLNIKIEEINKKYKEIIEAGKRVETVNLAKENAKSKWNNKENEYNDLVKNNEEFFRVHRNKIEELNSKLNGLAKINDIDITTKDGLNSAATRFKSIVEEGTELRLELEFYKEYIQNYYKALGDLRKNEVSFTKMSAEVYNSRLSSTSETVINPYEINAFSVYIDGKEVDGKVGFDSVFNGVKYQNGSIVSTSNNDVTLHKDAFRNVSEIPEHDITLKSIKTGLTTLEEFENAKIASLKFKKAFREYFDKNNNKMLFEEDKQILYRKLDLKVDYYVKTNEITYYQYMYEKDGDKTWLDKKSAAIKELSTIKAENESIQYSNETNSIIVKIYNNIKEWKKTNIIDIIEKNKITIQKLNEELEKALGINKNAIIERETLIANVKKEVMRLKNIYDNINPDPKDLALMSEYNKVIELLEKEEIDLAEAIKRLKELKDNLVLNDLKNIGENSIAIGVENIVAGRDSMAIGSSNTILGDNIVAIGNNINVGRGVSDAIVLGDNSTAISNTLSIGNENNLRKLVFLQKGDVSQESNEAINGSQLFEIINAKEGIINKEAWIKALNINANINEPNNKLVTDKDVKEYIEGKGYITEGDLNNKANIDGSNIVKDKFTKSLNEGANISIPKDVLVTDKQVNEYIEAKGYITNADLNDKANIDASNINVDKYIENLNRDSNINEPKNKLVTDKDVKEYIEGKGYITEGKLNNKANIDGSNIVKDKFTKALNEGANITAPKDVLVTDKQVNEYIESKGYITSGEINNKANIDASNINEVKYIEVLSKNSSISNPKNKLVTDTLVKSFLTENYISKTETGNIISESLNILNGENRIVGKSDLSIEIAENSIKEKHLDKNILKDIKGSVKYDDDKKNSISLGSNNITVNIKNVSKPIHDNDAVNKKYVDELLNSNVNVNNTVGIKKANSGVASAIAHGSIPFNNLKKTHSIGASLGYYNKEVGVSLGYSGMFKNVGVKGSLGFNSGLEVSAGFGISYTFGDMNNKEIIFNQTECRFDDDKEEIEKLKNELNALREELKSKKIENIVVDKFEFDSFELSKTNKEKIDSLLKKIKDEELIVIGHTDIIGSEEYNKKLSLLRAMEVKKYILNNHNISENRIMILGDGEGNPISEIDEENRRVEIIIK
ncbi:OmpA family protein [Streptobacillus canis]|uniref:OmpA family protein n=1 Tax=Streptobacillus canis TaxID=2678686 RepID=UPI0012E217F7|nr:OmpA family protein [Streptobacillus canis]